MKKQFSIFRELKSYRFKTSKSMVIVVVTLFALLTLSVSSWHIIREKTFLQISQNTLSKADFYANEIELRNKKIKSVLEEIADYSFDRENSDVDWNEQASFYIQSFEGIESISISDRDLSIEGVVSSGQSNFFVGQKVKDIVPKSGYEVLYTPIYKISELKGFVIGEINIKKLVLSVSKENLSDYEIQIYSEGNAIYTSENWESSNLNFSKKISFELESSISYELALMPSDEYININIRHTNQVLFFGLFLSIGIALLVWIALKLNYKSKLLLNIQETLISNQAELEDKNVSLQKQLRNQQKLESIGLLASGVAHEINNPINGILNYSQLIMESSDISDENKVFSQEIILETERISKLVSNLLQFSRQGRESLSFARIEDIIERAANLAKTILKKDQIELSINIPEILPDIKCHSQQIQQILMNLIINSRDSLNDKFADYNEDKIIWVTAQKIYSNEINCVRITVEDHGKGIPLSIQNKIFQQFFTTKVTGKGTGLGLAISYEIAKEHNGNILFETKEGEYTKFHLDLPVI